MRRPILLALVLLPLLSLLPPAAAQDTGEDLCIIFVTPAEDWSSVEVAVDLILTDEELANVSREVDADGDGNVTAAEVEAYEAESVEAKRFYELGDKRLLLDNRIPANVTFSRRLAQFEGPVDEARKRLVTEVRVYAFEPVASEPARREVRGGPGADYRPPAPTPTPPQEPVIETVVIRAPAGWVVWTVNGTAYNETRVTIRGFETREPFTIEFAREGYAPPVFPSLPVDPPTRPDRWIPAPPAALAALVVAAVAAVAATLVARRAPR